MVFWFSQITPFTHSFSPLFSTCSQGRIALVVMGIESNVVLLLWLQLKIKGYDFNLCWCCCRLWCKLNVSRWWTYGVGLNMYLTLVIQVWDEHWGPHWIYLTKHSKINNNNMDHIKSKENMITCIWIFLGIWST